MHRAPVIIFVLLLSACARDDFWFQQGKSESDMQIARYECTVELRDKHGMYGADKNSPAYASDLKECMIKKGYILLQEPKK